MARSTPSLLALLGIAAVAGYQNRDRLGGLLGGAGQGTGTGTAGGTGSTGGGLDGWLGALGGGGLAGGIGELVERFRQSGRSDRADSWIGTGENHPVTPAELEQALGEDTLHDLTRTTGLSRSDILERLARNLPQTVDRFTPQGRLPSADEVPRLL